MRKSNVHVTTVGEDLHSHATEAALRVHLRQRQRPPRPLKLPTYHIPPVHDVRNCAEYSKCQQEYPTAVVAGSRNKQ
ncbi:uncharacterized protein H6S33_001418 [Morchella sextelata]|uniref:uncharacterized protein n=1 Tax=Morchella sextelata TaxID=1174677 RepID=UPI001D048A82|nr:uncharacterized protein H6S33_001418 [Morchella sextelata]KAH0609190.1 hypothetical protein H6S33_001418 [Morchella sextelata]